MRKLLTILIAFICLGVAARPGTHLPWQTSKEAMRDYFKHNSTTDSLYSIYVHNAYGDTWFGDVVGYITPVLDTIKVKEGWAISFAWSDDTITISADSGTIRTWIGTVYAKPETLTAGYGVLTAGQRVSDDTITLDSATVNTWLHGFTNWTDQVARDSAGMAWTRRDTVTAGIYINTAGRAVGSDTVDVDTNGLETWLHTFTDWTDQAARDTAAAARDRRDTLTAGVYITTTGRAIGSDTAGVDTGGLRTWIGTTNATDSTAFHHKDLNDANDTGYARMMILGDSGETGRSLVVYNDAAYDHAIQIFSSLAAAQYHVDIEANCLYVRNNAETTAVLNPGLSTTGNVTGDTFKGVVPLADTAIRVRGDSVGKSGWSAASDHADTSDTCLGNAATASDAALLQGKDTTFLWPHAALADSSAKTGAIPDSIFPTAASVTRLRPGTVFSATLSGVFKGTTGTDSFGAFEVMQADRGRFGNLWADTINGSSPIKVKGGAFERPDKLTDSLARVRIGDEYTFVTRAFAVRADLVGSTETGGNVYLFSTAASDTWEFYEAQYITGDSSEVSNPLNNGMAWSFGSDSNATGNGTLNGAEVGVITSGTFADVIRGKNKISGYAEWGTDAPGGPGTPCLYTGVKKFYFNWGGTPVASGTMTVKMASLKLRMRWAGAGSAP